MSRAMPWNNGAGLDARVSAREAARRQGQSLGEWLHGVFVEHAAGIGVAESDISGRDQIDAIATKLRDLNAPDGAGGDAASYQPGARSPAWHRLDSDKRTTILSKETAPRLEAQNKGAPARQTEHRLDESATIVGSHETRRHQEHQAIADMASDLSAIESTLTERARADGRNPINTALARLEARLEAISRRGAAETAALHKAPLAIVGNVGRQSEAASSQGVSLQGNSGDAPGDAPVADAERSARADEQLAASPADATTTATAPSGVAVSDTVLDMAPNTAPPRISLNVAIAEITRRQRNLDGPAASATERPAVPRRREPVQSAGVDARLAPCDLLSDEIARLTKTIEGMRQDFRGERDTSARGESILGESIKTLTSRLEATLGQDRRDSLPEPLQAVAGDLRRAMADIDPRAGIDGLKAEVRAIAGKVDALAAGAGAGDVASLKDQVSEVRGLLASTTMRQIGVGQLEDRVAKLVERIERQPRVDVDALERLIRDLGRKIEVVQTRGAGGVALDELQRQIGGLAARFEWIEGAPPMLASIEHSIRDLFAHLDATRASVDSAAEKAALQAVRLTAEEGRLRGGDGMPSDVAALHAMQDEADARTNSTLSAVHEALDRVVGRLSTMEADFADMRSREPAPLAVQKRLTPVAAPGAGRRAALKATIGTIDPVSAAGFERRQVDPAAKSEPSGDFQSRNEAQSYDEAQVQAESQIGAGSPPPAESQAAIGSRVDAEPLLPAGPQSARFTDQPMDLDHEAGRADFIAAARRAVKVAQNDPDGTAIRRPMADSDSATRAGLLERSRDYVASHKKPVLLGVAALFVMLGTMALMQRLGFAPDGSEADRAASAQMAAATPVSTPRRAAAERRSSAMTGSALASTASAPIAGSDPIQTGSLASLPAFVAPALGAAPARASLPSGLTTMAEAGNGAAEYALGLHYAEGNAVARDLKVAARWFGKAAAQGNAPAQYRLGALYEKGLGVAQDKTEARTLYRQAANSGNPRAMHNLAVMLAEGDGKPDYKAAALWFRRAAQYGVHDSQFNLAVLLARGLGLDQSLVQSYQWFAIAAEQNDSDAARKRDEVGTKLSANDVAVAKALATAFRPRSADPAALAVQVPPGGWDGAAIPSHLNSGKAKISAL